MDATLIDTEPRWVEVETILVEESGGTWSEEQGAALTGVSLVEAARTLQAAGVGASAEVIVSRMLDHVVASVRESAPWLPGARELVEDLAEAGVPLALVTSSYRSLADAFLGHLPRGTFAAVVTGDEVAHSKPHPEPYLTALSVLGVSAGDAVAVEDSPSGLASTFAAGVPTIAVATYGTPVPVDGPPRRVVVVSLDGVRATDLLSMLEG